VFMVAFGIKAAMFPFFFWLPASYHTPPVPVSAVFAGLLTKVGVYALIRVFTLVFINDVSYTHTIILVLSGLTMAIGVLGAVAQNEFRKILSFHIISQIGYMTMGLGLFTPLGVAGSIFYIAHHIIVKANLFLVSGLVYRMRLSFDLKQLGGMNQFVLVSLVFLVPAMSLAGIPPLSGFFAKLALVRSGIEAEEYAIVGVALAVGFFTLFSMVKIWNEAFAKVPEGPAVPGTAPPWSMIGPTVALAILTIGIGIGAGWLMELSIRASEQLLQPAEYIEAVLGERGTP
jgi:multicomponent Na+:H+ antiporter subunit D